jgi:hypothetical protein
VKRTSVVEYSLFAHWHRHELDPLASARRLILVNLDLESVRFQRFQVLYGDDLVRCGELQASRSVYQYDDSS